MKKDRNCGNNATPYPVYQMQQPMMPMAPMYQGNMPYMQQPMTNQMMNTYPMNQINYSSTSIEQQLSTMSSQITNLERRVNTLENIIGASANGNNYNTSNFQMM